MDLGLNRGVWRTCPGLCLGSKLEPADTSVNAFHLVFSEQGNDGKLHNCMFWTWEMIGETQFLGGADDMCNILLGVYPLCQMV